MNIESSAKDRHILNYNTEIEEYKNRLMQYEHEKSIMQQ